MAGNGQVSYAVTAVTDDTQFNGTSTPVPGKRVAFSTSAGYTGSVFVPDTVFGDKAAVVRLIEGQVKVVSAALDIAGNV